MKHCTSSANKRSLNSCDASPLTCAGLQAAQPALLYIVPGVLGCVALHAALNKELKAVFDFSEAQEDKKDEGAAEPAANGAAAEGKKDK